MKTVFLWLLSFYRYVKPIWHQVSLSVFGFTPTCKYQESCSRYTERMIRQHGTIPGLIKGLRRLKTCW